jgi:hypothetical protein
MCVCEREIKREEGRGSGGGGKTGGNMPRCCAHPTCMPTGESENSWRCLVMPVTKRDRWESTSQRASNM